MTASKPRRVCAHCGATFATITEHLTHVAQVHDRGMVRDRAARLRRTSFCWRCAGEIERDAPGCRCGWVRSS